MTSLEAYLETIAELYEGCTCINGMTAFGSHLVHHADAAFQKVGEHGTAKQFEDAYHAEQHGCCAFDYTNNAN